MTVSAAAKAVASKAASVGGAVVNGATQAAGAALDTGSALAAQTTADAEQATFIQSMDHITSQSNALQLALAQMQARQKIVEGFAKMLSNMNKAATQIQ